MTTVVGGFSDEITAGQAEAMADHARRLLYHDPWVPHVTAAYTNTVGPAAPVIEALGRELPRCDVAIDSISLICQAPEHLWTWHSVAEVQLGG
jgi:2'-5' RNA ligase